MQRVDPFVPVVNQNPPLRRRTVEHVAPRPALGTKPRTIAIDGMLPQRQVNVFGTQFPQNVQRAQTPALPRPISNRRSDAANAAARQVQISRNVAIAAPQPTHRRILSALQAPAIVLAAMVFGLALQSLIVGEIAIAAYAVFALIRRIESRTTFLLALFSLCCVILLLAIRPSEALTANFAVYAFLLLAIGTVTLGLETRTANA